MSLRSWISSKLSSSNVDNNSSSVRDEWEEIPDYPCPECEDGSLTNQQVFKDENLIIPAHNGDPVQSDGETTWVEFYVQCPSCESTLGVNTEFLVVHDEGTNPG